MRQVSHPFSRRAFSLGAIALALGWARPPVSAAAADLLDTARARGTRRRTRHRGAGGAAAHGALGATFQPLPPYLAAAAIYWMLSLVFEQVQRIAEARLNRAHAGR